MASTNFLFVYLVFLFFTVFMVGLGAPAFISEAQSLTPPSPPDTSGWTAIFNIVWWAISNIGYFFSLMTISSTIRAIGLILITPAVIIIFWMIIGMFRGAGT